MTIKFILLNFTVNPDQYCTVKSVFDKLFLVICDVLEYFGIKFDACVYVFCSDCKF
jgi:hypothetical protein